MRQARSAFQRLNPAVVVGFGGYPSLPALLAAKGLHLPRLIHEQNAVLGRVNRFLSPRVQAVACAFPTLEKAHGRLEPVVVGNPVRPEIRALYGEPYSPPGDTIRILVTGGSQGARILSEVVPAAVCRLPEALRLRLRIEQQARPDAVETARRTYLQCGVEAEVAPFFRDMAGRLARAALVIGAGGGLHGVRAGVCGAAGGAGPLRRGHGRPPDAERAPAVGRRRRGGDRRAEVHRRHAHRGAGGPDDHPPPCWNAWPPPPTAPRGPTQRSGLPTWWKRPRRGDSLLLRAAGEVARREAS